MDTAPTGDSKPKMIRCRHCGAENREDAAFCTLCLTRFAAPEEPQEIGAGPDEPGAVETPIDGQAAAAPPAAGSQGTPAADAAPVAQPRAAAAGQQENRAWDEAANAFSSPKLGAGDEIPDALAGLPPELQMELIRPTSDFDTRKLWMRGAMAVALAIVSVALSIGILAMLINQRVADDARSGQSQQDQAAPQAQAPAQTEPAPTPAPSAPESHPDLSFAVPSGWTGGGNAGSILLSGPNEASIEIKSWERGSDGRYNFANGPLSATTESGAASEMPAQLLQSLYGGSAPATATASPTTVGSASGSMAELRGEQGGAYKQAYGFVHGDWTYMALGSAPLDRESELKSAMQSVIGSVRFRQ